MNEWLIVPSAHLKEIMLLPEGESNHQHRSGVSSLSTGQSKVGEGITAPQPPLMEPEHLSPGINLDTLLEGLPACRHCRASRRRCDTKLPSCANCTRADRECTYYDHVLKEDLPRSYIASLVHHLEALEDQDTSASESSHSQAQHYFAFSQGAYRYLGAQSPLLDLCSQSYGTQNHLYKSPRPSFPSQAMTNDGMMPPAWHGFLLQVFLNSIHHLYPILDPSLPWLSPGTVMCLEAHPTQAFMLQMVYGIACHCDSERSSSLLSLASAAHGRALKLIEKATAEQSTSTLQVAILLVLYALFNPSSGNVSQQLGFAIRLAIDLAASDNDEESTILTTLHKIIYCLENDVGSVLVRPTSLPEPSTPLTFSTDQPLDFLCSLYRIQSRVLRNITDGSLHDDLLKLTNDEVETLHPNILSTLWETRLMMESSTTMAIRLISAYSKDGYIATFLTAHRVHKAANIIIDAVLTAEGPLKYDLMLAYGNATALLGRWSGLWEAAGILLRDIQSRMSAEAHRPQPRRPLP